MKTYGVLDKNDCHIDVARTEKGAKRYATNNGYDKISVRYDMGYNAEIVAEKIGGKWKPVEN